MSPGKTEASAVSGVYHTRALRTEVEQINDSLSVASLTAETLTASLSRVVGVMVDIGDTVPHLIKIDEIMGELEKRQFSPNNLGENFLHVVDSIAGVRESMRLEAISAAQELQNRAPVWDLADIVINAFMVGGLEGKPSKYWTEEDFSRSPTRIIENWGMEKWETITDKWDQFAAWWDGFTDKAGDVAGTVVSGAASAGQYILDSWAEYNAIMKYATPSPLRKKDSQARQGEEELIPATVMGSKFTEATGMPVYGVHGDSIWNPGRYREQPGGQSMNLEKFCETVEIHIANPDEKGYEQIETEITDVLKKVFDDYGQ